MDGTVGAGFKPAPTAETINLTTVMQRRPDRGCGLLNRKAV
jgi:hypothetical protein